MQISDFASNVMPEYKFLGYWDLPNSFYGYLKSRLESFDTLRVLNFIKGKTRNTVSRDVMNFYSSLKTFDVSKLIWTFYMKTNLGETFFPEFIFI